MDVNGIIISGLFSFAASALSIWLIYKHLINYTKPVYQRHIVRILLLVPIFSFSAWFTYIFPTHALAFELIRSCYEAFVIYDFFSLILRYLGENSAEWNRKLSMKDAERLLFPLCCIYYDPKSWHFLMDMRVCVLQYVFIRPITTIIAFFLEAAGLFRGGELNPQYGFFYYTLINFISVSVAMYSLILFFMTILSDIKEYRPVNKFLSVKFVVFMTFWQTLIIGTLARLKLVPASEYWTSELMGVRLESFLLCIEMFLASLWHTRDTCFGYGEYRSTEETKIRPALVDAFNPYQTIRDTAQSIHHLALRSRQMATRPGHEPVQGDIEMDAVVDLAGDDVALTTKTVSHDLSEFHQPLTELDYQQNKTVAVDRPATITGRYSHTDTGSLDFFNNNNNNYDRDKSLMQKK